MGHVASRALGGSSPATAAHFFHYLSRMRKRPGLGGLFIIGGKEDKNDKRVILRMLAKEVGKGGKLVVATVASDSPRVLFSEYSHKRGPIVLENGKAVALSRPSHDAYKYLRTYPGGSVTRSSVKL